MKDIRSTILGTTKRLPNRLPGLDAGGTLVTPTRALLLGATFAVSAALIGCSSTGGLDVDGVLPLPLGGQVTIKVSVDINGNKRVDVDSTRPMCVRTCYSGADGADLGCVTMELPGSGQVPAGAVRWESTAVKCPETSAEQNGGGGGGGMFDPFGPVQITRVGPPQQQPRVAIAPHPALQWEFFGGSIVPADDGSPNVTYSFGINAATLEHAEARRDMVLAGGIGTSVGSGFDVVFYNEARAEFDIMGIPTGVRMRQAEVNDDFTTYRLTVNNVVFAELGVTGNLLHYGTSNQWSVVETFIPTSAFDTTPGSFTNQADVDWTSAHSPSPWHAMQSIVAH